MGEHLRIVVLSTSEGDDKAVKYPAIFQGSGTLLVTKIDLLPHTNFCLERITADMKRLAPDARCSPSPPSRRRIAAAADWLAGQCEQRTGPTEKRDHCPERL